MLEYVYKYVTPPKRKLPQIYVSIFVTHHSIQIDKAISTNISFHLLLIHYYNFLSTLNKQINILSYSTIFLSLVFLISRFRCFIDMLWALIMIITTPKLVHLNNDVRYALVGNLLNLNWYCQQTHKSTIDTIIYIYINR